MPGAGSDVRRRNRLIVAVSVAAAVVVVALLATHRTSAPVQLPAGGGTLTSGEFDGSCDGFDDSFPCSGNVSSVVAVDVRRSRFLVVWIANLTRSEHGHEVGDKARARFVSTTGRLGPTITLANDDVNAGLPISASYQAGHRLNRPGDVGRPPRGEGELAGSATRGCELLPQPIPRTREPGDARARNVLQNSIFASFAARHRDTS